MITKDTHIISDTHFGHQNIIRYCNRPENNWDLIIRNWKEIVKRDDVVLHLGDVTFKDRDHWMDRIEKLPGRIFFIKGNHDHSKTVKRLKNFGWTLVDPFVQEIDGTKIFFSHYPNTDVAEWSLNIHGHIHNNDYSTEFLMGVPPQNKYFNASIEVMDYRPQKLNTILSRLKNQF